jgi:hypothetical protein
VKDEYDWLSYHELLETVMHLPGNMACKKAPSEEVPVLVDSASTPDSDRKRRGEFRLSAMMGMTPTSSSAPGDRFPSPGGFLTGPHAGYKLTTK